MTLQKTLISACASIILLNSFSVALAETSDVTLDVESDNSESLEQAHSNEYLSPNEIIVWPPVDPWKSCANYADLQNTLKGDATFIATGYNLACTWNNSDVQPSITIKNNKSVYFAPGSQIFYCTKGGTTGKKTLWGESLSAGQSFNVFVPFGSGNTCLAKGVKFDLRNPPR